MKRNILLFGTVCLFVFNSCGPAAENREAMHIRAKAFQDSIAFVIKSSMAAAAEPAAGQAVVVPDSAVKVIPPSTQQPAPPANPK